MNMKTVMVAVTITLASSTFATEQIPETIIINGMEKDLLSEPLYPYLERLDHTPKVVSTFPHTALYRGYVGTWTLKENYLWLVSYETADGNGWDMKKRALIKLNKWWWRGPVRATWFTGDLYVVHGKEVPQHLLEFPGFGTVYERYLAIRINKGAVEKIRVIDHKTMNAEIIAEMDRPPLSVIGPDIKLKTVVYEPGWYGGTDDVAHMHGITVEAFRKLNGLGPDEELEPGVKVKVPCKYQ
jgi:hypothetical protein